MLTAGFETIHFQHAEELLKALAPEQGGILWQRHHHDDWAFRGQRDANWDLTPSAHRGDALERWFAPAKGLHPALTLDRAILLEWRAVAEFANLADCNGFEVPGDSPELRGPRIAVAYDGTDFPPTDWRWMFALAQHYRVPTRLLDWTYDPLTAAYFASAEAALSAVGLSSHIPPQRMAPETNGGLAVWALSTRYVRARLRRRDPLVSVLTVPSKSNPNLRAQRGLFTLVTFALETPPWPLPPLDKVVADDADRHGPSDGPMLIKFTLPWAEAPQLLYLLRLRSVSAATAYPGLDSLARAICEAHTKKHMLP